MRGGGIVHMPRGERVPVGAITMWPGATAPDAWLLCDGSSYPADLYPELADVLGTSNDGPGATVDSANGRSLAQTGTVPAAGPDGGSFSGYGYGVGPFSLSNYYLRADAAFGFTGDFAVSAAAYYLPSAGTFQGIAGCFTSTSQDYWSLYIDNAGKLVLRRDAGAGAILLGPVVAAGWHTFTVRVSGTSAVVKMDGATVIAGTFPTGGTPTGGGTPTFTLGSLDNGTSAPWLGSIHEVRVWSSALAQATLDALAPGTLQGTEFAAYFLEPADQVVTVPDLRGRFPLGKAASGTGSTLGGTGGAIDHTHSTDPSSFATGAAGAHNHGGATGNAGAHNHGGATGNAGAHNHGGATGNAGAHDHGAVTGTRAAAIDAHVGATGAAGGHDHGAATGSAGAHSHNVDPAIATTTSAGGHAHTVDPASATTTSAGTHSHTTPATATGAPSATQNLLGGTNPTGTGTHTHTLPAMSTSSDGAHTHDVDIPSTATSSDGAHTHDVDIPSTATSSDGAHAHAIASAADHDHDMGHGHTSAAHDHAIATAADHAHTVATQADHAHTVATQADHAHTVATQADHTHTVDVPATTSTAANPPFLALNFIIKAVDE